MHPDDNPDLLTDRDIFALLCRDGMGGYGGITLAVYDAMPDHVIRDSFFAEFDKEHKLVSWRQRRNNGDPSGSLRMAARELPKREELNIPAEAWQANSLLATTPGGQRWVLMWWQVWRRRQAENEELTDEYLLERFKKQASANHQWEG